MILLPIVSSHSMREKEEHIYLHKHVWLLFEELLGFAPRYCIKLFIDPSEERPCLRRVRLKQGEG
jgi:hypothetical protein